MKQIIAKGRQMGKSDLMNSIIKHQANQLRKSVDKMIIDDIWGPPMNYRLHKSWRDRRGRRMHRVYVNYRVLEWLEEHHNQYGVSNPEWWKFEGDINITDQLYTLLVLRWAE